MKKKHVFWYWHIGGWFTAYLIFSAIVLSDAMSTYLEAIYSFGFLGSACFLTYLVYRGFKKWFALSSLTIQIAYLLACTFVVTLISTTCLLITVFIVSYSGLGYPIPASQTWNIIDMMFWPNSINMVGLSLLWSCVFFAFVKVRQLIDTKQLLLESQLKMLNNQLNPHFLFNTINDIRALILENPQKARESLAHIADILRFSLQASKADKVALSDELDVLNSYLSLCKIGLENRLSYDITCEAPPKCLIPTLIIQLCVENAIKHGISASVEGGHIQLNITATTDTLQLEMQNPVSAANEPTDSLGIGLKNIQQRLYLLYKDRADIALNRQGSIMHTSIRLPLELTSESEQCA